MVDSYGPFAGELRLPGFRCSRPASCSAISLPERLSGRFADETMVLASSLLQSLAVGALALFAASDALAPWMIFVPGAFITFANGIGLSYAQVFPGGCRVAGHLAAWPTASAPSCS